jgi:CubicO group peptidase (beta-lactamase class C family)
MDKLSLDEDVNQRLTSWTIPDSGFTRDRKVTLRGLLSHSSGLADRADFQGFASSEPFPSLVEILEGRNPKLPQQVQLTYVPGTQWRYSGSGYCVMQQLVEDVTGKRFPAVARELVLKPLSMTNSSFEQPLLPERARIAATGHKIGGDPVPGKWFALPEALGGLWTTPTDLARFIIETQKSKAGETNRILSPAMTGQMLTRQVRNWGLGLGLEGEGQAARFQHGGSVGGFECNLVGYVGTGQGAVVMTSGSQGWLLAREILWSIARDYGWPDYSYAPQQKAVVAVKLSNLMKYVGRYEIDPAFASNLVFIVTTENGRLFVKRAQSTESTELHAVSDTTFFMLQDQLEVTFASDASGGVSGIRSNRGWSAKRMDK